MRRGVWLVLLASLLAFSCHRHDIGSDAAADTGTVNADAGDASSVGGDVVDTGMTTADAADGSTSLESITPVTSCNLTIPSATTCPSDVTCIQDLTYATVGSTALTFDFARPATGSGPFPLVVLIHGGGFYSGDKSDRRLDSYVLAEHGIAAASINYRLMSLDGTTNPFPAAVQDARCAVRSLKAMAASLGIDPTRVGVLGTSAGGMLTGLLATENGVTSLDGPCAASAESLDLRAVVTFYGVFDTRANAPIGTNTMADDEIALWLHRPPDDPMIDGLTSAITHVAAGEPPFLLVHGDADTVSPLAQSMAMHDALQAGGVPATLIVVPGAQHAFEPFQTVEPYTTASCTALAYFQQKL